MLRPFLIACVLGILTACLRPCVAQEPPAPARQRVLPQTRVFPRIQAQYSLYGNYLHIWNDRPLFFDRTTESGDAGKAFKMRYDSYRRIVESARAYEVSGLAYLVNHTGYLSRFLDLQDFADKDRQTDFPIHLEMSGFGASGIGSHADLDKVLEWQTRTLERAMQASAIDKFGGKILITSYVADTLPPEDWAKLLAAHRQRFGDKFLYVAGLGMKWNAANVEFNRTGKVSPQMTEQLKKYMRSYLDVCDGILMHSCNHLFDDDRNFSAPFYKWLVDLHDSVLSEPAYKDKLLGLSASVGYECNETGSMKFERGTKQLRQSFEIALSGNPDVIIMPEWGEVHENTCIDPTVLNSFSTQRIVRHYMRQIKGEPVAPQAGDDVSVPNLILSYRMDAKLGERLEFEVLNVPDSTKAGNIRFTLALHDAAAKVIRTFPEGTLAANQLKDVTFAVPSEELASVNVLCPSLRVTAPDGRVLTFDEGFRPMQLRPTLTLNYKEVKQPLRDLARPTKTAFFVNYNDPHGPAFVQGSFACNEEIASVEVIEDGRETFAVDPKNEFDRGNSLLIKVVFDGLRVTTGRLAVKLSGTPMRYITTAGVFDSNVSVADNTLVAPSFRMNATQRTAHFLIPRKDVDNAIFDLTYTEAKTDKTLIKMSVPVKRIVADGQYCEVFPGALRVTFTDFRLLPQVPFPLNAKSAEFETKLPALSADPVWFLQVVTKAGHTWRSRPVIPAATEESARMAVDLNVYSQTAHKAVTVKVDSASIPNIVYQFNPANAATLRTDAGPDFYGAIGGGFEFGSPLCLGELYPADATDSAPAWVKADGADCLKFDGRGNEVIFPAETLPQGSFTVVMDIKPTSAKDQILLRGGASGAEGQLFDLRIVGGKLVGTYMDAFFNKHELKSGLTVPVNEWSKVTVVYDCEKFVFRVGDKNSAPMPCTVDQTRFAHLVVGGLGKDSKLYFEGYLKSLRIVHSAIKQ